MRDYSKVASTFWTGDTGLKMRAAGKETQLLCMYLMTCPDANMYGLYRLAIPLVCHHLNLDREGALEALRRACEGGFCMFDTPSEGVFVIEMAKYQMGESLTPKDNRHKRLMSDIKWLSKMPFYRDFYRKYRIPFCLPSEKPRSPSEAPSKPLRSQKQKQKQEQEGEADPPLLLPRPESAPSFDLTEQGLAQSWCFFQAVRFNGAPAERLDDVVPFMRELLRHKYRPEVLKAEIENPGRDRTEKLSAFKKRIESERPGIRNSAHDAKEMAAKIARDRAAQATESARGVPPPQRKSDGN